MNWHCQIWQSHLLADKFDEINKASKTARDKKFLLDYLIHFKTEICFSGKWVGLCSLQAFKIHFWHLQWDEQISNILDYSILYRVIHGGTYRSELNSDLRRCHFFEKIVSTLISRIKYHVYYFANYRCFVNIFS